MYSILFLLNEAIDERIKQLEQQLNDPEDDGFVDVDSSSDSSDSGETNESMDTTANEKEVLRSSGKRQMRTLMRFSWDPTRDTVRSATASCREISRYL